jgi:hypothetical protein
MDRIDLCIHMDGKPWLGIVLLRKDGTYVGFNLAILGFDKLGFMFKRSKE